MLDTANHAGVHPLLPVLVVLVAELPGGKIERSSRENRNDRKQGAFFSLLCGLDRFFGWFLKCSYINFLYFSVWCSWVTRYCVGVSRSFSSAWNFCFFNLLLKMVDSLGSLKIHITLFWACFHNIS